MVKVNERGIDAVSRCRHTTAMRLRCCGRSETCDCVQKWMALRSSRIVVGLLSVVLFLALVLTTSTAFAGASVSELATTLRSSTDYRLRVQAALALGASKNPDAVAPLCASIDDSNAAVRTAVAAAIGRLRHDSGLACLEKREAVESVQSVKTQINQSIQQIRKETLAALPSRPPDSSTKWYVAVSPTLNKTNRSQHEINVLVQTAIRAALMKNAYVALAPVGETQVEGGNVVQKHKVRGYELEPTVEAPTYVESVLTVRVRVKLMSYPGKALLGEFSPKYSETGRSSENKGAEDELIKLASERVVENFIKVAESSRP